LWLDAPELALVLLVVSALNWCWLLWLHASLLRFKGERRGGGPREVGGREGERGGLGVAGIAPQHGVRRQQPGRGARGRRRCARDSEGRRGQGDADGVADRWAGT
jgi:hypothetical protein